MDVGRNENCPKMTFRVIYERRLGVSPDNRHAFLSVRVLCITSRMCTNEMIIHARMCMYEMMLTNSKFKHKNVLLSSST